MENAQLVSLSRQMTLRRQMDVVANNLANLNTTGFKAQSMLFEEFLMPVARSEGASGQDQRVSFVQDWSTIQDFSAGSIEMTGNPLDIALQGDGFLAVETAGGERWTRSGALQVNSEGVLVTLDGNPVLGDGGPIRFDPGETDITIDAGGNVTANGGIKGRLRVVEFANAQELAREGDNLFSGGTPEAAASTRVLQGALERSNVSGVRQITEMIRVQRSYESITSMMKRQDEIRTGAIQRLGNLNA